MYTHSAFDVGAEVVAPDPLVDLRAGEHLPRVAQEELEQVELGARELQPPLAAGRLARRRVERQVREPQRAVGRTRPARSSARTRARSSSTANGLTR